MQKHNIQKSVQAYVIVADLIDSLFNTLQDILGYLEGTDWTPCIRLLAIQYSWERGNDRKAECRHS